jgi:hypothetical protein
MTVTLQLDRPEHSTVRPHDQDPLRHVLAALVVTGKVVVLLLMLRLLLDPAWANLEGKAPVARAIMYPLWVLAVPVVWASARRAAAYPWVADLLVTLTCLTDLLGNRLDLYNSVDSFDDWMHFVNAGPVSAAFVVLTVKRPASFAEVLEAAVALGLTASLGWELFEYGTFLTRSTEWASAYSDTIGDLSLGFLGSVFAGLVVFTTWHRGGNPKAPTRGPGPSGTGSAA